LNLLALVTEELSSRGVAHALVGGLALAAHGISRSTMDADVLTADGSAADSAFWDSLRDRGATCEVRRGDAEDPFRAVIRVTAAESDPVDVLVGRDVWLSGVVARAIPSPDLGLPVVGAADLVLLKLFAGGPQDLADLARLLAGSARDALVAEVDSHIAELPAAYRRQWEMLKTRS
jgi:hypothetical protein